MAKTNTGSREDVLSATTGVPTHLEGKARGSVLQSATLLAVLDDGSPTRKNWASFIVAFNRKRGSMTAFQR